MIITLKCHQVVMLVLVVTNRHVLAEELGEYLSTKLAKTGREIAKSLTENRQSSRTGVGVEAIEFSVPKKIIFPKDYGPAIVFSLFDNVYVLMGIDLYYFVPREDPVYLGVNQHHHQFSNNVDHIISFIKTMEFNNHGFVITSFPNGVSHIFGYNNTTSHFWFIQSLQSAGKAADAQFFRNENGLYLFMLNNKEASLTTSHLYKWVGTHFDKVEEILTEDAISLVTFPSGDSEIITIIQNSSVNYELTSVVYELYRDKFRRTQVLLTSSPNHISTYVLGKTRYVVVFEDSIRSSLYYWDGAQLVLLEKFSGCEGIDQTFVATIDSKPIIFAVHKSQLIVINPVTNSMQVITKQRFGEEHERILDVDLIRYENKHVLIILALTTSGKVNFFAITFSLRFKHTEDVGEDNLILHCLADLEKSLGVRGKFLEEMRNKSKNVPLVFNSRMKSAEGLQTDDLSATNTSLNHDASFELKNRINNLLDDIANLKQQILEGITIVDGDVLIEGNLRSENFSTTSLAVNFINGKPWIPEHWLSNTQPQKVTGKVRVKNLVGKRLEIPENLFNTSNLLLKNNPADRLQMIEGSYKFVSLTTNSINTRSINTIPFGDIYLRSKAGKISGEKKIGTMKTNTLETAVLNQKPVSEDPGWFRKIYNFGPVVFVKNLNFDWMNGVQWKPFKDSVFQIGITKKITGNISFADLDADHLIVKRINGVDSGTFFTISTEQNLTSAFHVESIEAEKINCQFVNDINFDTDVATDTKNTVVKGTVTIDNISVMKLLNMSYTLPARGDEHVIGTNESDFLQTYTGKVKILGNLHLQNINFAFSSKPTVDDKEFIHDISQHYWLKSQNQKIPVFFEAQAGVTTAQLIATMLNNVPVSNYMVNDLRDQLPTNLVFENITVLGDIVLDDNKEHTPNLMNLDAESVKLTGIYDITSPKVFQGKLRCANLTTKYLDHIEVSEAITSKSTTMLGNKTFDNLVVKGDLVSDRIVTNYINGVNLSALLEKAVFVNRPQEFESMQFDNIKVEKLYTNLINGKTYNAYAEVLNNFLEADTLDYVYVDGNVNVQGVQEVVSINEINLEELFKRSEVYQQNPRFIGNVNFFDQVHTDNLEVTFINNINIPELQAKMLYREGDQTILAPYTFRKINTLNIIVPQINGLRVDDLINTRSAEPQNLFVPKGLQLSSPHFLKSLNVANLPCNVYQTAVSIKSPPTQYWSSVQVVKDVTILDSTSDVADLLNNAVNKRKNNTITAPVNFGFCLFANNIHLDKRINGIDLNELVEDAFLKDSDEPQIVDGFKVFRSLGTSTAAVRGNTIIPLINEINVLRVNSSIIPKQEVHNRVIRGQKTFFSGMQVNHLIGSNLSGLNPEVLVSLDNSLKPIPSAHFKDLFVANDLNFDFVDEINFTEFLSRRLLRNASGPQIAESVYFFDNIALLANVDAPTINDIDIEDVVFDTGVQNVRGPKYFLQDVIVEGGLEVEILNGRNLRQDYEQSILLGEPVTRIQGNFIFTNRSIMNGNIITEHVNGFPVNQLRLFDVSRSPRPKYQIIHKQIEELQSIVNKNMNSLQDLPRKYLYLEKWLDIDLTIPNVENAYTVPDRDHVLFHLLGKITGDHCGLPTSCHCPLQLAFNISPHLSIHVISDPKSQRVFSYSDGQIDVQVVTNSISSSQTCSVTQDALPYESTNIMWVTKLGSSHVFPGEIRGYVSSVEFFTTSRSTYAVINRHYDPTNRSHIMESLVLRFSESKDKADVVSTFLTNYAWTSHIFQTAQGIILVIGNRHPPSALVREFAADIYRFDPESEKFVWLRHVHGTGCTSAVGVALEADSLIVLAQENSPLQVLKYHPDYDNYYFYQNVMLDSPATAVSVFYTGVSGLSDAFLCVVSRSGQFRLYSFKHMQGLKLEAEAELEGLRVMIPFSFNGELHLLASTDQLTTLLNVVTSGPG